MAKANDTKTPQEIIRGENNSRCAPRKPQSSFQSFCQLLRFKLRFVPSLLRQTTLRLPFHLADSVRGVIRTTAPRILSGSMFFVILYITSTPHQRVSDFLTQPGNSLRTTVAVQILVSPGCGQVARSRNRELSLVFYSIQKTPMRGRIGECKVSRASADA